MKSSSHRGEVPAGALFEAGQQPGDAAIPLPLSVELSGDIDPAVWHETKGLLGERIDLVAGYFLEDGARSIVAIECGLQDGASPQEFVVAAQALKSSARQFGLLKLAELARRIEEIGRTECDMIATAAAVQVLLPQLRTAFAEASHYIQIQQSS